MTDPKPISRAEEARRLAMAGWSNREIAAITGLRPRSIRDALRAGARAWAIKPNAERFAISRADNGARRPEDDVALVD